MTIDEIQYKVNKNEVTDSMRQISADEVNAIVSQVRTNRDGISGMNELMQEIGDAETSRQASEKQRVAAETVRRQDETSRQKAESDRKSAENMRVTAESDRESSETDRREEENLRRTAEAIRDANEEARQADEEERQNAEAARQAAEEGRTELTGKVETLETQVSDLQERMDASVSYTETGTYQVDTKASGGNGLWYDSTSKRKLSKGDIVSCSSATPGDMLVIDSTTLGQIGYATNSGKTYTAGKDVEVYFGGDEYYGTESRGNWKVERLGSIEDILKSVMDRLTALENK